MAEESTSEIETCRNLAEKCLFIMGYARSSTTITSRLVNSLDEAWILTEANFFLPSGTKPFREWYNSKHVSFDNQISKSSYAPDFSPDAPEWWQWLNKASEFYSIVGDKIAFSSNIWRQTTPEKILSFFESHFFEAKYVFLMRDPLDSMSSIAKLVQDASTTRLINEFDAWLLFIQFWADAVRIFPNTLTLVTDTFTETSAAKLGEFLQKPITDGLMLLNPALRRSHTDRSFPSLPSEISEQLLDIYKSVQRAIELPRAMWQAEQKRDQSDRSMDPSAPALVEPLPLGEAWAKAGKLRLTLAAS